MRQLSRVAPAGAAGVLFGMAFQAAGAAEADSAEVVGLELVLAVDASGSVSAEEYALQMEGFASAFRDPRVVAAIERTDGGVVIALVQWANTGHQAVAIDWTVVSGRGSSMAFADRLAATPRLILGETAIDGALRFGRRLIEDNRYIGVRMVIDLSGDGKTNWGPDPDVARDEVVAAGVTVNGLAILNEQPDLGDYFRVHVIGGDGAFVTTADDYADFARAIRWKLVREIDEAPIASDDRGRPLRRAARAPAYSDPRP